MLEQVSETQRAASTGCQWREKSRPVIPFSKNPNQRFRITLIEVCKINLLGFESPYALAFLCIRVQSGPRRRWKINGLRAAGR
jgi:hypothetical protein